MSQNVMFDAFFFLILVLAVCIYRDSAILNFSFYIYFFSHKDFLKLGYTLIFRCKISNHI